MKAIVQCRAVRNCWLACLTLSGLLVHPLGAEEADEALAEVVVEQTAQNEEEQNEGPEAALDEKLEQLYALAELNPLAELQEKEAAVPSKESAPVAVVEEKPEPKVKEKPATDERATQRKEALGVAKEMCELRHRVSKNNLCIKMSNLCKNCRTSNCRKHYSTKYHTSFENRRSCDVGQRVVRGRSCSHSLNGEIERLGSGRTDDLHVSYELPNSPERLVQINRAVNAYKRENKELLEQYGQLKSRLEGMGFSYEEFGLNDKADTARVLPLR